MMKTNNLNHMKKISLFALLLAFVMTACYDDYTSDYEYTAAYFAYQYPVRTVVMDFEGNDFQIQVGAVYGGRYSYSGTSEAVNFTIADTLITNHPEYADMGVKLMPQSWYTLSDESTINIVDSNVGAVTVTIKRDSLTKYDDASQKTYVIPFQITGATTDSILEGKDFSLVMVKFKNQFDGRYYVKGVDKTLAPDGSVASEAVYSNPALVLNKYVYANTIAKDKLLIGRVGVNDDASKFSMIMEVSADDGSALLKPHPTSDVKQLLGAAQYDFANQVFVANYNYTLDGVEHSVADTLILANQEMVLEQWK